MRCHVGPAGGGPLKPWGREDLPALAAIGHDVTVYLPRYKQRVPVLKVDAADVADLIGSALWSLRGHGLSSVIVSADKDFGQLLSEHEYREARETYGAEAFVAKMGAEAVRDVLLQIDGREVKTATGQDLVHASAPYSYPTDSAEYAMHFTWPRSRCEPPLPSKALR